MEDSQSNQDGCKFGAFVDGTPGAALGNAGDMELHCMGGGTSEAGRASLKMRRPLPSSPFTMYDTSTIGSNRSAVGFSHSDSLPDEQSLASAFGDMSFMDHTTDSPTTPTNFVPFSAEHVNQKPNQLTLEHQEQAHRYPLHFGYFPTNSQMENLDRVFRPRYQPPALSASPIEQQFYIDRQSKIYAPYGQQFGSNFMSHHGMEEQTYPTIPPHYVYPQLEQVARSDVRRSRRHRQAAVCTSANGASHIGTPNTHRLGMGNDDPYSNGAAFLKRNNQLHNTYVNSFPGTLYADSSCDSGDFSQQDDKFSHPYALNSLSNGFSEDQISDDLSAASYPEKVLMRSDGVTSARSTKFAPSMNGCIGRDRRFSNEHNHLDNQSNDSSRLDRLHSEFLSLVMQSREPNYNSVDEVAGRIYMLAKDQNGCRFLQKVFAQGSQEDVEKVFGEIIDHIGDLMVDPFGNYLVQKLLEGCSEDQRMRILCEVTKMPGQLIAVSCNMHGTRAVQKIIETINSPDQVSKVVSALSPGAMHLMLDPNGSHVANRCLQKLLPESKVFLLDAATLHYLELATHQQGCCIIQKCIEHSNDEQKYSLLSNIISSALTLSDDQFGNYVIQSILNHNIGWATCKIVDELEGHFGYLSMQKCGSHVVENCLRQAPQHKRDRIIGELMNDPKLPHIMVDQFGNFVIQTALEHCKGTLHTAFVEAIRPHAAAMQSHMYGKRVLSKTYLKNKQHRVVVL
ncbi:pumilio homolog 12 isoform X2 [Brachypodium distachyon]|uniref:PUM-HD domain-containing protein n=1 Tax=Brachypodium distachyon TaxID=15368 RepID=A0A2K2CN07_BRADI|nr:pumilio homolog 12 isoform X2 [Brachypodium distachyon]PNT63421.1 hypothetical protein BRADI_4g15337v3 [Brachypodium distachyon]|eukprot:XP_024318632.1 pumilio homolog 12 isoform X2 [Brachypodium distachyon]